MIGGMKEKGERIPSCFTFCRVRVASPCLVDSKTLVVSSCHCKFKVQSSVLKFV